MQIRLNSKKLETIKEYPLSINRSVKRLGIPDSQIILMVADDMACNPRKYFIIKSAIEHSDSDPPMVYKAGMRIRIRSDPLIFGPPDPDPTFNNGFIKLFSS